ncbi:cleavage/polyadenylation factor ia subunit Clp1p [Heliocybe sulcata]|uniref:Polynucleotide 5'-hydroxyl-kinase GRC3 n=1 Tax=Heliocybe sulcata TaxID=5364 RepID=A0A5C3NFB6_9AGAM|nr:cleavage/polyadenylation factor ia subunit Clp1p [Heliocybe sulcata]
METGQSAPTAPTKEWVLEPETEYRFELDPGTSLAAKLIRGQAEIFGAELVEGKSYVFGYECKAAIYTWQGCTIEIKYVSEDTPMAAYANVHTALEQRRVRALQAIHGSPISDDSVPTEPPRVLVLGPANSGKTTVCKILTNYAVRTGQGWSPILVNLDPNEGAWAVPGAISAASVNTPIATSSPANTLGAAATSAPVTLSSNALLPLFYWYGHKEVKRNALLMDRLIRNLGQNVQDRDEDPEAVSSGVIVDAPAAFGSSTGSGLKDDQRQVLIKACVDAFNINIILIVGHEKLTVEMQRIYGGRMDVVKIPKSGGVVELDHSYRDRVHSYQLHTYMYGLRIEPPPGVTDATLGGEPITDLALAPASLQLSFDDLSIFRIGEESMAPQSALPIGATRSLSEMQPVPVDASKAGSRLVNAVLALLAPPNPDESERYDEEILDLTVVGFVIITALDMPNRKMTILSPNQGSLAGRTAIVGSFEWSEA